MLFVAAATAVGLSRPAADLNSMMHQTSAWGRVQCWEQHQQRSESRQPAASGSIQPSASASDKDLWHADRAKFQGQDNSSSRAGFEDCDSQLGCVPVSSLDQLLKMTGAVQIVPNFRVRTIPVLGAAPAAFGIAAASWILCQIAGQPFQSEPIFLEQPDQYEMQLNRLTEREHLVHGNSAGPPVDLDDVSLAPDRPGSSISLFCSSAASLLHGFAVDECMHGAVAAVPACQSFTRQCKPVLAASDMLSTNTAPWFNVAMHHLASLMTLGKIHCLHQR